MTEKRIYDDPKHPQYGPVRRMWVILAQLDLLESAERFSEHHTSQGGATWDETVAANCRQYPDINESAVQRALIYTLMEGWI